MKRKIYLVLILIVFALITLSGHSAPASAKPADAYTVDWYTIDGGGAMNASSGTFTLSGTLGQADAGRMTNGMYVLTGGFWSHILPDVPAQLLPMILKNP